MRSVSVVIRYRNHRATLPAVLGALAGQTLAHQLIGVDSGSTDGSSDLLLAAGARIVPIAPRLFTYGRAINVGLAVTEGDAAVLLSAHTVPNRSDALERLVSPLAQECVAGAYGRQLPFSGMNPFEARIIGEYYGSSSALQSDNPRFSNAWSVVRLAVWQRHPFNETIPGAEDQLWADEVQRAGWKVAYVAESTALYMQQFGIARALGRYTKVGFALQTLRRTRPPRLDQALRTAIVLCLRDARAWSRGEISSAWMIRSPVYRFLQSLGNARGARMAWQLLDGG